jgi:hypothetical protein
MAQQRGFYIGAAVAMPLLDDKVYQQTLKNQFNICVAENRDNGPATRVCGLWKNTSPP